MRWIRCTLTLTLNPDVTLALTLALTPDAITLAVTNPTLNPPLTQDPSATLTSPGDQALNCHCAVQGIHGAALPVHGLASHPPD